VIRQLAEEATLGGTHLCLVTNSLRQPLGAENHAHSNFTLTDEASAAGANGETNGDFPPPADRTRHKQVGNVRAGDDQHQAHDKQHCAYQRQAALAARKTLLDTSHSQRR
jgi:hypothetical protein